MHSLFTFCVLIKPCGHRLANANLTANEVKTSTKVRRLQIPRLTVQSFVKQLKEVENIDVKRISAGKPFVNTKKFVALSKRKLSRKIL